MIVEVKQGQLEGQIKESILSGKEYYSFLGIPYAKPPVGELRFQVSKLIHDFHITSHIVAFENVFELMTFLMTGTEVTKKEERIRLKYL